MQTTVYLWDSVEMSKCDLMATFKQKECAWRPFTSLQVIQGDNYREIFMSIPLSITYRPSPLMNPGLWILASLWESLRPRNLKNRKEYFKKTEQRKHPDCYGEIKVEVRYMSSVIILGQGWNLSLTLTSSMSLDEELKFLCLSSLIHKMELSWGINNICI